MNTVDWPQDVFDAMKARGIATVATVPDGGLTRLLKLCEADGDTRIVTLTTEEEGVGVTSGLWLGGRRGMLAMQSSGVGNCINALGYAATLRAPCLMLVTMRGQWGEFNPWQVPMGQAARTVLEAMGVKCFAVDDAAEVGETFAAAADLAFNGGFCAAVLVGQRIIGAKGFGK
jgi:sulfopyruvate decarboxylase alpha subunit